jgi:hypothetical protein
MDLDFKPTSNKKTGSSYLNFETNHLEQLKNAIK